MLVTKLQTQNEKCNLGIARERVHFYILYNMIQKSVFFEKKSMENFHIPLKNSIFAVRNQNIKQKSNDKSRYYQ